MTAKIDGTNGLLQNYDYQVLTTAFSYTFAAGTQILVINPAGTLATGTITMPAAPADGMTITFSSTKQITALTLSGNTGQTVVSAATLLPANQATTYVYRLSNTSWYPVTNVAGAITRASLPAGTVVQVATSATGALATGTTTIPFDDTIPQITEGTEFMTLAITPSSATNSLIIQVTLQIAFNNSDWTTVALFQDTTANALAATTANIQAGYGLPQTFTYKMTAGTTSSTTFRVRAGAGSAGTATVNGTASARRFGGVMASTMTIYEVAG